jgi:hypothetical protein
MTTPRQVLERPPPIGAPGSALPPFPGGNARLGENVRGRPGHDGGGGGGNDDDPNDGSEDDADGGLERVSSTATKARAAPPHKGKARMLHPRQGAYTPRPAVHNSSAPPAMPASPRGSTSTSGVKVVGGRARGDAGTAGLPQGLWDPALGVPGSRRARELRERRAYLKNFW